MIKLIINNGECECNVSGKPCVLVAELIQAEKAVIEQIGKIVYQAIAQTSPTDSSRHAVRLKVESQQKLWWKCSCYHVRPGVALGSSIPCCWGTKECDPCDCDGDYRRRMTTECIIAKIFYYGVIMANDKGTKSDEESLRWCYKELERRGVVDDWESAYQLVTE